MQSTSASSSQFRPEVRRILPWLVGYRFLINVTARMSYTFLPAFARGSDVSVGTMSQILSARELTSLSAPLAGQASDRNGTANVMIFAGLVVLGGLAVSVFGTIGFIVGMLIFGVGRTAYQVAMQAWVGDEVAYERRGRATGLIELSWGGAALLGLPMMGLLIEVFGWRAPFIVLSIIGVPILARIQYLRGSMANRDRSPPGRLTVSRTALAALLANAGITAAAQFVVLGHGLWLEDTYGLDAAQVGLAIVAVGVVEVIATLGSARVIDILGKRRSILAGSTLMTAALAVLAVFPSPPLAVGLAILVTAFLGFEFAIVSAIPLIAELDPSARAQMIALVLSISTVTRAVITLVATAIYVSRGFSTLMTVASLFGAASVWLAAAVMVEPTESSGR